MRTIAVGCVVATTWIASVAGQSGIGAPITAIGCLNMPGQTGSVGGTPGMTPATPATAGVLANSSDPTNVFMLNGATTREARSETRTPAEAGRPTAPTPASYVLDGKRPDLQAHVGHRIEVTGALLAPNDAGPGSTKNNVKHIRVESVRMLASTCPAASAQTQGK